MGFRVATPSERRQARVRKTLRLAQRDRDCRQCIEHEVRHCAWKSSLCVDAHSVTIPEKHCNIKGLPVRHCAWAHAQ